MQNFLRIVSILTLLAIVGYGVSITGSPAHTRMVNEDIDTLEQLEVLHNALAAYHHRNGESLSALDSKALNSLESGSYGDKDNCRSYYSNHRFENEQWKRYEYTATPTGYKICTTLNSSWQDVKLHHRFYENQYSWAENFQKGMNCFERTIPECKKRN